MSTQSADPQRDSNVLLGIALKVLSLVIFVAMQGFIKAAGQIPTGQITFFRSFFAMLPILVFLAWRGELQHAVATKRPLSHIGRGIAGVTGMLLGFYALTRLPLPEAIALNYAQPLLVVVFSALFMGEVIRIHRWSAVIVGLVGVVIISYPRMTLFAVGAGLSNQEALGVTAALLAACASAVALIQVRNLVHTERSATIVMWFSLTCTIVGLMSIPFGWAELSWKQGVLLAAAGICGGAAQLIMTQAYRHAEASTVAPFEYASLLFGVILGYFAFSEVPTIHMLIGGIIVIGSGLFIVWRERQLGLKRDAARKVTLPE